MPTLFQTVHAGRCRISLLLLVLCFVGLAACGYKPAAFSPSILGDGTKTLKIKEIDNPTLESWVPHSIRTALRDEVNARHLARWVDSGPADYEISIIVLALTQRESIHDRYDQPLLYDNLLRIRAIVYDGATNQEIWRSRDISYSDRVQNAPDNKTHSAGVISRTMQIVADELRATF